MHRRLVSSNCIIALSGVYTRTKREYKKDVLLTTTCGRYSSRPSSYVHTVMCAAMVSELHGYGYKCFRKYDTHWRTKEYRQKFGTSIK